MPQQYSLYRDLSVAENLQFFGRLYCLPREVYRQRAERLLGITRLARFTDRRADALSGGMYKKLALACALLHEPEVLFLDEPTNGVDPVSRRELWALLHEFVEGGMTVLVSTPYMDEAERCRRVALVHRGRLVLEGEPASLIAGFEDEAHEVRGGARDAVDAALASLPAVRSTSPAGSRLRIVVARGSSDDVAQALRPLGASLERVAPDFEDLFLSRIGEET
jgi:ABC-2 type transport system ATP-binding protein